MSVSVRPHTMGSQIQPHPYLKQTLRIGSCKGPISYDPAQTVFHHDDIPESKRERKREVRDWARSKILSAENKEWNRSTTPGLYPMCERRSMELHKKDRSHPYQYNFRAETLDSTHIIEPIDQPGKFHISRTLISDARKIIDVQSSNPIQRGQFKRTTEMPVHPNLEDATAWNTSTKVNHKDFKQSLNRMTSISRAATAKVSHKLGATAAYRKPVEQSNEILNDVRKLKKTGQFRKTEDHSHGIQDNKVIQENYDYKNRYGVEPSRKYKTNEHSGKWEFNKVENRYMWSDTGSFVYESKGDIIKIHKPDALNLEGPTSFNPKRTDLVDVNHVDHR